METNPAPNEPTNEPLTQPTDKSTNEPATKPEDRATGDATAPKTRKPRRQKAVIDRIEDGKYAVLLVGSKQVEKAVPVEQLPEGATAGAWLKVRVTEDGVKDMLVDEEATQAAQSRVRSKLEILRNRPGYFQPMTPADTQHGGLQPLNPSPSESQGGEWKSDSQQK